MEFLDTREIRRLESRYVSLFGRTLKKGMYGVPAPAYRASVKRQFKSSTFRVQLDAIINDLYRAVVHFADTQIDGRIRASTRRDLTKVRLIASEKPLPLTVELVKQSTELSETAVLSIIEMMKEEGIYELHPNTLAKRLNGFFDGEKHRAVRFARTVSADIANNTTLHRYRQRKISRWQFSAKLDAKTTDQCRMLHGTIFETDSELSDNFRPPLHFHCRSAMLPVPLSMKIEEGMLWENRDFSQEIGKDLEFTGKETDVNFGKAFEDVDKFKQKYTINKFILDEDAERRLIKLGLGIQTEPKTLKRKRGKKEEVDNDKPTATPSKFKRGSEVRDEITKKRAELERTFQEMTVNLEILNQERLQLIKEYDELDYKWRIELASDLLELDSPKYFEYQDKLKELRKRIDEADAEFSAAMSRRTKVIEDISNVIINSISINDGKPSSIYSLRGYKDRAEYEDVARKTGDSLSFSPYNGMGRAEEFLNKVASEKVRNRLGAVKVDYAGDRAYTRNDGKKTIFIDSYFKEGTILHETGHQIEFNDKYAAKAAKTFLKERTKGEKARTLRELTGKNYRLTEKAKKDKFINPYMGKIYEDGDTEIISMGVQMLKEDPDKLMVQDPELFDLIIDILRGNLDED